jgi:hypothetical protein
MQLNEFSEPKVEDETKLKKMKGLLFCLLPKQRPLLNQFSANPTTFCWCQGSKERVREERENGT